MAARIAATNADTDADSESPGRDAALRADVRLLGRLLGESLVRQEGPELLALVEPLLLTIDGIANGLRNTG